MHLWYYMVDDIVFLIAEGKLCEKGLLVLVLLPIILLFGCSKINISKESNTVLTFCYGDLNIEQVLTSDEAKTDN